MKPLSLALALIGFSIPPCSAAEPDAPRRPATPGPDANRGPNPKRSMENWKAADTNGDGEISREEFAGMERLKNLEEEKRLAIFKRLDKDANGGLSREELERMHHPAGAKPLKLPRLAELDVDHSGGISFAEFKAGEVIKKLPPERQQSLFHRLDINRDGVLSPADHPPHVKPFDMRGLFRRLDKNEDAALSLEEFNQAPMLRTLPDDARKARFLQLDANHDEKLDVSEFSKGHPRQPGGPSRRGDNAPGSPPPPNADAPEPGPHPRGGRGGAPPPGNPS